MRVGSVNYISLTDLAKYQNSSDPSFTVKNWLRRITTIDYVGLWEEIHNDNFNLVEFDQIKTEYGRNSFAMSPKLRYYNSKILDSNFNIDNKNKVIDKINKKCGKEIVGFSYISR